MVESPSVHPFVRLPTIPPFRPAHLAGRRAQRWSRVAGGQRRVSGGLPLTGASTAGHSAPLGRTRGIGLSVNPQPQGDRLPHRRKARTQATHVKQRGALLLLPSPYRGHGSLRGRTDPPQHLVRSTGAAMSTAGLRLIDAAQRPRAQPPVPSPRGQPSHPWQSADGSRRRPH
jgi:hypothetical protein